MYHTSLKKQKDFSPLTKLMLIVLVFGAVAFGLYSLGVFGDTTIGVSLNLGTSSLEDGLVAHYTFDGEDMIDNVADRSGQGNHGYLQNFTSTTTAKGRIGQALEFDGSDDFVDVGNDSSFDLQNMTVSLWYYNDREDNNEHLIGRQSTNDDGWRMHNTFNTFRVRIMGVNYDTSILKGGVFSYITFSYDGANIKQYLNGELVKTTAATPTITYGGSSLSIGDSIGSVMKGILDDVRIYDRALTDNEIQQLYNLGATTKFATTIEQPTSSLEDGLIGHWTFDGPDLLENAADRSGQGNHGYLTNFTSTTTAKGRIGQALEFDGDNDYVEVLDSTELGITGDITISMWFNPSEDLDANNTTRWLEKGDNYFIASDGPGVCGGGGEVCFLIKNSNSVSCEVSDTNDAGVDYPAGEWVHIIAVKDSSNTYMYKNGELQNTTSCGLSTDDDNLPLSIGSDDSGDHFPGTIDDVRIYNRALSADEVTRLYNLGATTKIGTTINQPTSSLESGLVGHWTFDGPDMLQNAADRSGQGNHGYLTNFTSTTTAKGRIGQALEFDGSDDFVDVTNIGLTEAFTISYWYLSKNNDTGIIIGEDSGKSGSSPKIGQVTDTFFVRIITDSDETVNTPAQDTWHHFLITRDSANKVDLYVNAGTPSRLFSDAAQSGTYTVDKFGANGSGSQPFFGIIDDVRIYNRALTADEVQRLYDLGQ